MWKKARLKNGRKDNILILEANVNTWIADRHVSKGCYAFIVVVVTLGTRTLQTSENVPG